MSAIPEPQWTVKSYLAFEEASDVRHEYVDGYVYAMAGVSRQHDLITGNVFATLHAQLKDSPCEVHTGDMRVRVNAEVYAYPDVSVVCDKPQFGDEKPDTLLNPTVIFEVLSPTTERFDRGKKSAGYRAMPSLQEYVLIAQDEVRIEHYVRQSDHTWLFAEYTLLDGQIMLKSLDCTLSIVDVYAKTDVN